MASVHKHRSHLELLGDKSVSCKIKKAILSHCCDDLLCCITSICFNLLRGTVPLRKADLKQLKPHRKLIYKLGDPRISAKAKRKQLIGGGGGGKVTRQLLPLVIGLILSAFDQQLISA